MADKPKDENPNVEDVVDEVEEEIEDDTDDNEEVNWNRLRDMIGEVVEERLTTWQSKQQKTTSSRSQRKAEPPKRKQGFLTDGFFKGLTDK